MKLLLLLGTVIALSYAGDGDFSYDNQEAWTGVCGTGKRQSPVDIAEVHNTYFYKAGITFQGETKVKRDVTEGLMTVKFDVDEEVIIKMPSNWPVGSKKGLKALQLHFHWGKPDEGGSEHFLFGKQYKGELHLVTRNLDQDDATAGDYLSVFGLFLQTSEVAADIQNNVNDGLETLLGGGTKITLNDWYSSDTESILTYEGGLTTPDCHAQVFWQVLEKPVTIAKDTMTKLRAEAKGKYDLNYRKTQPMYGRYITNRVLKQAYDTDQDAGSCAVDCMAAERKCMWSSSAAVIPSLFLLSAGLVCLV